MFIIVRFIKGRLVNTVLISNINNINFCLQYLISVLSQACSSYKLENLYSIVVCRASLLSAGRHCCLQGVTIHVCRAPLLSAGRHYTRLQGAIHTRFIQRNVQKTVLRLGMNNFNIKSTINLTINYM